VRRRDGSVARREEEEVSGSRTCSICGGAIPDCRESDVHTALCAGVVGVELAQLREELKVLKTVGVELSRQDERNRIVKWLRGIGNGETRLRADQIERGEHDK
jgi:hypothetical protein